MVSELEDGSVTHCAIHEKLVKQKRKQLQMLAHTHTRTQECPPTCVFKYRTKGCCVLWWGGCSHSEVKWAVRRCLKDFYYIFVLFLRCRGCFTCIFVFPFLVFSAVLKSEIASAALNGAQHNAATITDFPSIWPRSSYSPSSFDAKHFRSSSHNLMQILLLRPIPQIRLSVAIGKRSLEPKKTWTKRK